MNGKLIVFEGPDGSGKTTILKNINEKLIDLGYPIMLVREPGGTSISEQIREIIIDNKNIEMNSKTECLLFAASRAQLVEEKIKPALNRGEIILCDRFVLSSLLYQGVGRGLGIDEVKKINDFATGFIKPDLTIFFNIDYKTALIRKRANFTADRLEREDFDFHKKIFDAYIDLSEKYKEDIKQVDASLSIDQVSENVLELIEDLLEE
ncbi:MULTISPECIES: dTMP kinase [Anaerococcus]|uniref:Thymidylate kinase n=1 Tax=Anaerococcus nagyae TaxID=1755241 RepID=A0A3E2TFN9_9FIRM|nr:MULTISPECIES: dTMP kinase [Anaerococcus]MBP2070251.1 dTMP kinase [Anaerococcus nagyae]MDU1829294.1 dTMP kinase [Anaerococcus sp.]MDU1864063.1 dTMP kinase [Anaerococcus sp.]MDU2354321.1 dTMP kinase [Anaerococcus sp.]MDU2566125.1 dTMP kinase [Anaerococcus sp.]